MLRINFPETEEFKLFHVSTDGQQELSGVYLEVRSNPERVMERHWFPPPTHLQLPIPVAEPSPLRAETVKIPSFILRLGENTGKTRKINR